MQRVIPHWVFIGFKCGCTVAYSLLFGLAASIFLDPVSARASDFLESARSWMFGCGEMIGVAVLFPGFVCIID